MVVCGLSVVHDVVRTLTVKGRVLGRGRVGLDERWDLGAPDVWVAPGFIDLQINGYGGHDFAGDPARGRGATPEEVRAIIDRAAAAGTALMCPTLTTDSREATLRSLRALTRALEEEPALGAAVLGIHLEGPYISSEEGPRGAHPPEHARDPDWDEFQAFQEAANGRVRLCTLAPERPGALRFIERLREAGVTPALGHTAASPEVIRDAVRAGARLSTHLGNGCHAQLPRHPNYLWEQLAADELAASVIADGHHLPPSVVRCIARVKGHRRLALVSDAVALGGMPPGKYDSGRLEVLPCGKVVLSGTPYLAGAGHLLDLCLANLLRWTGMRLREAVRCVTAVPARVLGLEKRKGGLGPGRDADLTLFRLRGDGSVAVVATVRGGEVAYSAPEAGRETEGDHGDN